jgi:hypothetical protein
VPGVSISGDAIFKEALVLALTLTLGHPESECLLS